MALDIPGEIATLIRAARQLRRRMEALNSEAGSITVGRLLSDMSYLQSSFETIVSSKNTLQGALTDPQIDARREFANDIAPALANVASRIGTLASPGSLLAAGQAVQTAFLSNVAPRLGAVSQGDGTYLVPALVWNSSTNKLDGDRTIAQAVWPELKAALPTLIAELEVFG